MIRILCAASPGELRIALCEDETLEEYAIWRPGAPDGFGDVLIGRVTKHLPALAGMFVALPDAEGFLPESDGQGLTEGALVKVRVIRAAQGGKGPRLARVDDGVVPDGASPGLLERGKPPLQRLAARFPVAPIEIDEPGMFATLRPDFAGRLHLVKRAFSEGLESEIEGLGAAWTELPGGLRAGFFPTPALTAIDLDGGASSAAPGKKPKIQFAYNRDALPALARQIRLRNLSGAILVDFAGLAVKRRAALGPYLAQALAADPLNPRLLGFSQLGLAEILRPRTTPPLHELLAGPHAAGLAALRRLSSELAAAPGQRPRVRAAPEVAAALQADQLAMAAFMRLAGQKLTLQSDPSLPTPICITDMY